MKTKIKKYIKEAAVFFVILFLAINIMSLYRSQNIELSPDICPKNVAAVHFWATWCPVCKSEISNIGLLSRYANVQTVVVKSGDDKKVKKFLRQNDLNLVVFNDKNGIMAHKNGISVFPTTIICHNGKVKFTEVGYTSTFGLFLRIWLSHF